MTVCGQREGVTYTDIQLYGTRRDWWCRGSAACKL